ncbi:MAG: nitroreductase [Candidatus Moranbacteria bacterium CG_4_10_14_3_um_filter_44_15]|nr:MAG: nitroreductase [Candidatus Moranbacteria bacterium CG06_land_8_20_14_3_00_43_56]PIV84470.1 MAG: nitroreductase [Candidatus Moranbacteria bacterium CG17_big_fil_post_rev_8_21_14_2_50_44_12]PIW93296.1 MAG: nitroreductase [Candidatus Moranbacteria bacterium CG_4_8_14_3_um_filter_43_15]PIX90519.1 MAG: nitroreductase [Candidatus Moranbacteria bacterium CG_4_10_14_3_um_filter_44_15]PJA85778.1 MAG: nitroreductase [Candidatus Moranbacteria bacterium CG_4_9_14_3_um_filter_44_28]
MHEIFQKRKSTRGFIPKKIEKEKLDEILEAAHSAPSAGNLKAREILAVADERTRERLAKAAFGQDFVAEAPLVLVFLALPKVSAQKYGERGRDLYAIQDATIAASFAWLQAVDLGLSGCWVGAFDEEEMRNILNLDDEKRPVAILPIGYAD